MHGHTRRRWTGMGAALAGAVALGALLLSRATARAQPPPPWHDHRPTVQQSAGPLPDSSVTIEVRGEYRYITANGIPDHTPGRFPNRGNPNAIRAQHYAYRVPLHPERAAQATPLRLSPFGVAINGVPFDPGAAEWWNGDPRSGWQYEALSGKIDLGHDASHAHVQPTGAYHYHGVPTGLLELHGGADAVTLIGYAADGFPIYGPAGYVDPLDPASGVRRMRSSYRLKSGARPGGPGGAYDGTFVEDWTYVPGAGDLDECNGRFGVTPEYPDGIYHYHVTDDFPFIPRRFRGTPDPSFLRHGPPPGGMRRPPPPPRF